MLLCLLTDFYYNKLYSINWLVFRGVRKIAKSDYYLRLVCPSAWNKSDPTGTDIHLILYLNNFRKTVEKIRVSLKSDKNNRYYT